jgi:type IV pilus assembly protein PilE
MISNKNCGFTLIEIMVVVAIVAILTAIAVPSYKDYVIRAKITHAFEGLSQRQTQMEQCYQDKQGTYVGCPSCRGSNEDFVFSCIAGKDSFTLAATGLGALSSFVYTVDQANTRTTTIADTAPSGWSATSTSCWITGKGGKC